MGQKTNSTIAHLSLKNSDWNLKYIEKNKEESSLFVYKNIKIIDYLNKIFNQYGFIMHTCKIKSTNTSAVFIIFLVEKRLETVKFYSNNLKDLKLNKQTIGTKHLLINNKNLINFITNHVLSIGLNLFLKTQSITIKVHNLNKNFESKLVSSKQKTTEYQKLLKIFRPFLKNNFNKELLKLLFIAVSERNSAKLIAETINLYFVNQKKRHGFGLFFFKKVLSALIVSNFSKVKGTKIVIAGRINGAPRANKKILKIGTVPLQSFNLPINYYESTAFTSNGTFGIKVWVCDAKKH